MDKTTQVLFLCVIQLSLLATGVTCIKCYMCDSDEWNYDPSDPCLDDFKGTASVPTCEGDVCVKAKGELFNQGKTVKGVQRACFTEAQAAGRDGCIDDPPNDAGEGSVCYCRTELCNTSNRPQGTTLTVLTCAIIVAFLLRLL